MPVGLEGFIALTEEVGGRVIELADSWLKELDDDGLAALRARLEESDIVPVISSGLQHGDVDACIRYAQALGADLHALRADPDPPRRARGGRPAWHELVESTRREARGGGAEGRGGRG